MTITNEHKIALLEFLGYEIVTTPLYKWWQHVNSDILLFVDGDEISYELPCGTKVFRFEDSDALDISILTKALDIIEKTHDTSFDFSGFSDSIQNQYRQWIWSRNHNQRDVPLAVGISNTKREEAILEAILAYKKTVKPVS